MWSRERHVNLSCETVTREAAGTTNLSRTNYTYAYSTANHYRQLVQEEELCGTCELPVSNRATP